MDDVRLRIRQRLEELGLSMRAVSRAAGLGETFLRDFFRNEDQDMRYDNAVKLAPELHMTPEYLMEGRGEPDRQVIPLRYHIGAGAIVMPFADDLPLEYVEVPPGSRDVRGAAIVTGTSQLPVFREGDVVFWGEPASDPSSLIGLECACTLDDERVYLKKLGYGSKPGLYTLSSYNEEDMVDVRVVMAAAILWVKRALSKRV